MLHGTARSALPGLHQALGNQTFAGVVQRNRLSSESPLPRTGAVIASEPSHDNPSGGATPLLDLDDTEAAPIIMAMVARYDSYVFETSRALMLLDSATARQTTSSGVVDTSYVNELRRWQFRQGIQPSGSLQDPRTAEAMTRALGTVSPLSAAMFAIRYYHLPFDQERYTLLLGNLRTTERDQVSGQTICAVPGQADQPSLARGLIMVDAATVPTLGGGGEFDLFVHLLYHQVLQAVLCEPDDWTSPDQQPEQRAAARSFDAFTENLNPGLVPGLPELPGPARTEVMIKMVELFKTMVSTDQATRRRRLHGLCRELVVSFTRSALDTMEPEAARLLAEDGLTYWRMLPRPARQDLAGLYRTLSALHAGTGTRTQLSP